MSKDKNTINRLECVILGTGTSTGVPVLACDCPVCSSRDIKDKRLRTSALVNLDGKNFVIDCGPDFRYQLIRERINDIEGILFTHAHRDHIAGLDDVRAFNYVLNKSIDIYCNKEIEESIRTEFPYIFKDEGYFGRPRIDIHTIENKDFLLQDNFPVTPILLKHDKMDVYGYRIGDMTYITDGSSITDEELEKVKGSRVLIINALRKSRHISHFSLDEAMQIIDTVGAEHNFLTHMSHFIGIHSELEASLPSHIKPACDGLRIIITPDNVEISNPFWHKNVRL